MKADSKIKWSRVTGKYDTHYCIRNTDGEEIVVIRKMMNCQFWYVYIGVGQDDCDGHRFDRLWEAKMYAEEELRSGRLENVV